ncbi:MAG: EamA family transporter [Alphaproteobacteria bacterium]|nr:EamA family transporter [Alphaproteobacteria bacterium]
MWLFFAFASAFLMGFYDVSKKRALLKNSVIPVLLLNTFFSSLFFIPLIVLSYSGDIDKNSLLYIQQYGFGEHLNILAKAVLVLTSWVFAYFGLKHLPITIVGPINAARPIWVLLGAIIFFGEKLSVFQWLGVCVAILSFYLLSRSSKKEGIDFSRNKWILFVVFANIVGAFCGLYDKYLLAVPENGGINLAPLTLLSWYNIYQFLIMTIVFVVFYLVFRNKLLIFRWSWGILLISIFLTCAELSYFYSLSLEGAMISIVSMIRRSSVVVSFLLGALMFREKNLKAKAFDLLLVLVSMVLLYIGSR